MFYDSMLAPTGLRVSQYSILVILREQRDLSVNELAKQMDLDRTTMGKNLRPLQRGGLIRVASHASDRRIRVIELTVKGAAALKAAAPLWRKAQKQFEERNGDEAMAALRETLANLRVAM